MNKNEEGMMGAMDKDMIIKEADNHMFHYWIGFAIKEDSPLRIIGYQDEVTVDRLISEYKETGNLVVTPWETVQPSVVTKLETKQLLIKLPREGNE
jgi:hypothetical protein